MIVNAELLKKELGNVSRVYESLLDVEDENYNFHVQVTTEDNSSYLIGGFF